MTLLILACTLSKQQNWWPSIVTVFYLLVPFPLLVAKQVGSDPGGFGGQSNAPKEWAYFVTTGIIISALALPIVMAGVGTVSYQYASDVASSKIHLIRNIVMTN